MSRLPIRREADARVRGRHGRGTGGHRAVPVPALRRRARRHDRREPADAARRHARARPAGGPGCDRAAPRPAGRARERLAQVLDERGRVLDEAAGAETAPAISGAQLERARAGRCAWSAPTCPAWRSPCGCSRPRYRPASGGWSSWSARLWTTATSSSPSCGRSCCSAARSPSCWPREPGTCWPPPPCARWRRCGGGRPTSPRASPASACRSRRPTTRSAGSGTRSTRCSTASRPRSRASARSWPTRATSCARRWRSSRRSSSWRSAAAAASRSWRPRCARPSEETDRLAQLADDLLVIARSDQGRLPISDRAGRTSATCSRASQRRFARRAADAGVDLRVDAPRAAAPRWTASASSRRSATSWTTRCATAPARWSCVGRDGTGRHRAGGTRPRPRLPARLRRRRRSSASRGRTRARSSGGAGLGLAIVEAIATAHGGSAVGAQPGRRRGRGGHRAHGTLI